MARTLRLRRRLVSCWPYYLRHADCFVSRLGKAMSVSSPSDLMYEPICLLTLSSLLRASYSVRKLIIVILHSHVPLSELWRTCDTSTFTIPSPSKQNARLWRMFSTKFLLVSLGMVGCMSRMLCALEICQG